MSRHTEMARKQDTRLSRRSMSFTQSLFRGCAGDLQHRMLRGPCVQIDQVHDRALALADDSGVGFLNKVSDGRRVPMISTRHAPAIIQPLLDHGPFAFRSHEKTMEVDLKAIGDRIVVDAGGQTTGSYERFAI